MKDLHYYERHSCCPVCGNRKVPLAVDDEVRCVCGWVGRVRDMVPAPKPSMFWAEP